MNMLQLLPLLTEEQHDQYLALSSKFKRVAGSYGWPARYCDNMAAKCMKFGLETMDRFPQVTYVSFKGNMKIMDINSRIIFKAMEEEDVKFADPAELDREIDPGVLSRYTGDRRAELNQAFLEEAKSVLEMRMYHRWAWNSATRGLENLDRLSKVTRPFFDAVLNTQSDAAGDLVERVLHKKGLAFRKQ